MKKQIKVGTTEIISGTEVDRGSKLT